MREGSDAEKYSAEKVAAAKSPHAQNGHILFSMAATVLPVLIVFALYARTLDLQSLVFEEGLSIIFCSRRLPQLMHTLIYEDLHPPLHYLLLHFWMLVAGNSEMAVRMPSALAAVLLIPLSFAVVQEVWSHGRERTAEGTGLGIAAAGLVASSPFVAYYAQETRMYSLVATLALATTWSFLRATRCQSLRHWCLFACLLAASLYTQYFSVFLIPAFLLYALLLDRRSWRPMLLSMLVTTLLYLPWVGPAYLQMRRLLLAPDYWVTTRIDLGLFFRMIWNAFLPSPPKQLALLGALLAAILLMRLSRGFQLSQRGKRTVLVLLTSLIPLAITYAAVTLMPKFVARYTIVAAAPLYICLTLALYGLLGHTTMWSRALFHLLIAAAIVVSLRSALAVLDGRENRRDDIRSVSAYLTQHAQPNDAFLLVENAPYAFQYYYHGSTPQYGLHVGVDFSHGASTLNEILRTRPRRLWLILWHHEFADPTDMLVTELLRVGREVDIVEQFWGYQLRAFDIQDYDRSIVAFPDPEVTLAADFAPSLHLLGFDRLRKEGGQWHYVLYWEATKPLQHNYRMTFSMQDQYGNEYLRRNQALSTDYFLPPVWPLDTPIRARIDLTLPADLPAIHYQTYLSIIDPDTQRNVDLVDARGAPVGQALLLEEFALSKADLGTAIAEITNPLTASNTPVSGTANGLELLGFGPISTEYGQGNTLGLTLWWRRVDLSGPDQPVQFRLRGQDSVVWEDEKPLIPDYPMSQWREGEVNRAVYRLAIPSDVPGGEYDLQTGIGGRWTSLSLLRVVAREHRYDRPVMQQVLDLPFEGGITLLGYDLAAPVVHPGETASVTLYWQTQTPITTSYKVSVQLLSPQLQLVAQDDSIPVHWTYPTTAWLPGEIISDEHILTVASEAPPGSYSLIALIYDPKSNSRLSGEQAGRIEDHATLSVLEIVP